MARSQPFQHNLPPYRGVEASSGSASAGPTRTQYAVLVLGCFTVVMLVAVASRFRDTPAISSPSSQAALASLDRFFAAVNTTLATGDGGALAGVLAEGFVLHADEIGVGAGGAALEQYLTGIGLGFPGVSFVPLDVSTDGTTAVVAYAIETGEAEVAAWPVPPGARQTAFLRLSGSRVAELWGLSPLPAMTPIGFATVTAPTDGSLVGAARVRYAPGAANPRGVLPGPLVILLEQGALLAAVEGSVDVVRAGSDELQQFAPSEAGQAIVLHPGDLLIVPALTWHAFRNDGTEPAEALELAILPATAATWSGTGVGSSSGQLTIAWPTARAAGVIVRPLAGGTVAELPAGEFRIALGRATLAPAMSLRWDPARGTVLLLPESGELRVEVQGTGVTVWQQGAPIEADVELTKNAVLLAATGQSPQVPAGPAAEVVVRNDSAEPVVLLTISIQPVTT